MGQVSGGILHEFNNILTVISGTIDILAQAIVGRPEFSVITRLMDEAAVRGARLTSHLIGFERGHAPQLRTFDLGVLVTDTARLLRPALGAHADLAASTAVDPLPVLADPALLMAALLKLIIAVRDAVSTGGHVSIVVDAAHPGTDNCALAIASDADVAIKIDIAGAAVSDGLPTWEPRDLRMVEDLVRLAGGDFFIEPACQGRTRFDIRLHRPPPGSDD